MRVKVLCLTGTLSFGSLMTSMGATPAPCGAIAWVESVSASGTKIKCGWLNTSGCETPACATRLYQTQKTVITEHYVTTDGAKSIDYSQTLRDKYRTIAQPPGTACQFDTTSTGTYSAHFVDGNNLSDCSGVAFSTPPAVTFCPTYVAAQSYLYLAHFTAVTPAPPPCPAKTSRNDLDPQSIWKGSTDQTTTTYEDPISDSALVAEVQKGIATPADPGANGTWSGGASSSSGLAVINGLVQGSGTKCLYRFKVAGTDAGTQYEIRWEVWETNSRGTGLFKSEKTSFTGNGRNFQYVDGRVLDMPGLGVDECQTGGATRFVKPESIRVLAIND
ncbi:MAG: hypothetical protein HY299_08685 [Verrucomicrobia bacterium]|nr:hypothetical protein [Verrucomicrobiota bacterium]